MNITNRILICCFFIIPGNMELIIQRYEHRDDIYENDDIFLNIYKKRNLLYLSIFLLGLSWWYNCILYGLIVFGGAFYLFLHSCYICINTLVFLFRI
jgi:ABC-type siderophore export system fused ATPase/permease subunit